MENGKTENEIELFDVEVGEDKPQVTAKTVVIEDIRQEEVNFGNDKSNKLVLVVKHPDIQDTLEISGAECRYGDKIKSSGLWLKLDSENKLPYNCAVAQLLRHKGKGKVRDLKGEQIETVTDQKGYLQVKAY